MKVSGIGANLYVAEFDLSGDVGSVETISSRRAMLEVPSLLNTGMERVAGLRDGEISFSSWWDTAAGAAHPALSTMPTADRIVTYANGTTLGAAAASLSGKQIDYSPTRGQDGSLAATVQALANNYGLEWGQLLTTGKQTFASAAAGTSIDDYGGTSTAFGAAAYLHVFSIGSGTATVAVQDSASAGSGFANLDNMVFTAVTGATSQRVQGTNAATVRRYIRVNVTGTFTNLVCALVFVRYLSDPPLWGGNSGAYGGHAAGTGAALNATVTIS
ncbi:MAG TPA: hypothetical protein VJL07_06135 [Dehalococcoidia bacterium]|nr:hypothetical protein [Dehalococcoidia bacterium]